MKFLAITLIVHAPDPITGRQKSTTARLREVVDNATLDQLSGGRRELIIGKGNGAAQAELFLVTSADQWDRNRESYELFRRLWREDIVTWSGRFRPSLTEAEGWPKPLQQPIRVLARQCHQPRIR